MTGHADAEADLPGDDELEVVVRFTARGCCGDRDWDGALCRYHIGMLDGMELLRDWLEVPDLEPDPEPERAWGEDADLC